jgi:hypothetical protein
MDVDLSQSWNIGDSGRDIEAGLRAGCKTILISRRSQYESTYGGSAEPKPDYKGVNMKEAVNIIKQYHRSSNGIKVKTQPAPESESQPVPETESQPTPEPESKPIPKPKVKPKKKRKRKPVSEPEAEPALKTTEQPNEQQAEDIEQSSNPEETKQLLNNIMGQLKSMQRANMFGEFSIMRLIAGVVQIIVIFCLLITVWLLMRPARQDNLVLISLGFAMVLQMMSLTFYIMHGRK